MKNNDLIHLRRELEQIPSQELERMLHSELKKDEPDGDRVRMMLRVLEERQAEQPAEPDKQTLAARERFLADCAQDQKWLAAERRRRTRQWVTKAAAAAAVVCLLILVIPTAMGTGNVFTLIGQWTNSVIEFFKPGDEQPYVFKTENPALQKVYDEVTKLGVTVPVVPTWVPDGYELTELKTANFPTKIRVSAVFTNEGKELVYTVDLYGADTPRKYEADDPNTTEYELQGITHDITSNNGAWVAMWERDNLECSLTVDCQEDIFYKILESIYNEGG